MGERFGECRPCGGSGYVLKKDPVLLRSKPIVCLICDGTGLSGDAMEQFAEERRPELEQELREIDGL